MKFVPELPWGTFLEKNSTGKICLYYSHKSLSPFVLRKEIEVKKFVQHLLDNCRTCAGPSFWKPGHRGFNCGVYPCLNREWWDWTQLPGQESLCEYPARGWENWLEDLIDYH